MHTSTSNKTLGARLFMYAAMAIGTFLAAFAIEVFFFPNNLIDGGTMGIAMILANLFGQALFPLFLAMTLLPFIYLAYRSIGKTFVIHTLGALALFV
ncbi:MAG: YitT family protein, partial [Parachlamydiaceae bacterium]